MKSRHIAIFILGLVCTRTIPAQNLPTPQPSGPPAAHEGSGQRGGRGGFFGGNVITGTVTAVAADHYTIRTETGESYAIHFSVNTRMLKQSIQRPGESGNRQEAEGRGQGAAEGMRGNPPLPLKAADIKVGDEIGVIGEVDTTAKSVGAMVVVLIDPVRAREMRAMLASFGKTWVVGKVTAINEAKVTLLSSVDNAAHTFVADENTAFRKRREPLTLADLQVGDNLRVEGAVKDGIFVAATVAVMGMQSGGTPSLPLEGSPAFRASTQIARQRLPDRFES